MPKQRNVTASLLQAALIVMVVDEHCNAVVGLTPKFLPYNAFFMPLFVMISGFFFKKEPLDIFVKKKVKRVFVPYLVWSALFFYMARALSVTTNVHWINESGSRRVLYLFFIGPVTSLNEPAWFACMLFWVSVAYGVLVLLVDTVSRTNTTSRYPYVMPLLCTLGGLSATMCCTHGLNTGYKALFVFRTLFYMQFYSYGTLFRSVKTRLKEDPELEHRLFVLASFASFAMFYRYGTEVSFPSTSGMGHFTRWWTPTVTSVCNSYVLWYVLDWLAAHLDSIPRPILFLSDHTATIMETHLAFICLTNGLAYGLSRIPVLGLSLESFDYAAFCDSAWYRCPQTLLPCFLVALFGSLLVSYALSRLSRRFDVLRYP